MSIRGLDALVLHTARLDEVVAFYEAIGITLEEERHDDGPVHWACELGPVHFAVFDGGTRSGGEAGGSPGRRVAGATQFGFQVSDLGAAVDALRRVGAEILQEPEEVPWGHRAVIADPDGRPVELNQAAAGG